MRFDPEYVSQVLSENFEDAKTLFLAPLMAVQYAHLVMLADRGIIVVPDVIANAGGVTVSCFEWVQGFSSFFWDEDEVDRRLEGYMKRAYTAVAEKAAEHRCSLRGGEGTILGVIIGTAVMRVLYNAINILGIYRWLEH